MRTNCFSSIRVVPFFAGLLSLAIGSPVQVSHPVTGFLKRLEEKGSIAPGFLNTLPRDSREVAAALTQAKEREATLSAWDRQRLNAYLSEFSLDRRQYTRLRYRDSSFVLQGHVEYYTGLFAHDSLPHSSVNAFGSLTVGIDGTYRQNAYFTGSGTIGSERSTADNRFISQYLPSRGLPYNTNRTPPHTASTFDGFRTVIGFGDSSVRLEAGQDWNQWGPGQWQHTSLSGRGYFWVQDSLRPSPAGSAAAYPGNATVYQTARSGYRYPGEAPPLPQIRFRIGGSHWEYTKVVAQRMGLDKDSSAALVAHRLQLRLGNWAIGGTEMLTIGTRRMDGILFLPGIPLKFAEHSNGDRDNSALSADVEWIWRGHGRLYGELFLDDFSGGSLNYWGNKFAWVMGASLQDPLGLPTEVHLEYAHVDPWVYGHHLYNTAMQNYGSLLGSSLPPNSRAVFASASFPLPSEIEGFAEWTFRQRDTRSPGSSIFDDPYLVTAPLTNKNFLENGVETRNTFMVSAGWRWRRYVQLRGGVGGLWVSTWHGESEGSLVSPQAYGEVYVRY